MAFGGLTVKQCGGNRYSIFDSMLFLIFYDLGLKTRTHAPKTGVLGNLTP